VSLARAAFVCLLIAVACAAGPSAEAARQRVPVRQTSEARVGVELPALGPGGAGSSVFVDAVKQASPWTSTRALDLDRLGYPTSLERGQVAESIVYLNAAHPSGDFTLLYRGRGSLSVEGATVVERSAGRMVVRVAADAARVALRLTATDPVDYIRDVHFVLPGFEGSFGAAPFNPQFVESLRGVGLLRFGQWMHGATFASSAVSTLRPTTGSYTQAGPDGVAPEYIAALANEVGAEPWLTLPAGATDGYVYAFADTLHRLLDPRLRALIEYGDLTWQEGTPSNNWAVMAGRNLRLSGDPRQASLEWYALRSKQVFAVAQRAFGADAARVVRVLSGPLDDRSALQTVLAYAGAAAHADAFFVSTPSNDLLAQRAIVDADLRPLAVGSFQAAVVDAREQRGEPFEPNTALRFVPTAPEDEAVEARRPTVVSHPAPARIAPNLPPAREPQGPSLTGSLGVPLATVDLTREGTTDWVHWGRSASLVDRKARAAPRISDLEHIGGASSVRASAFAAYRWNDGSTLPVERATRTGLMTHGPGSRFALSVPADATLRVLRVYVEARHAQGRFVAALTDGSAPRFVDESLDDDANGHSAVYTLEYRASHTGARLAITFVASRVYRKDGGVAVEAATLAEASAATSTTPADETTFHNDGSRSGWNPTEPVLTAANVGPKHFGLLQTLQVDGVVLAQPLYLYQYAFPTQGTHNVLLVATENNTLYEFDADTYALINSRNFGTAQNSNDVGCSDIEPIYGITSTPVIERSSDTIYLVAATEPSPSSFVSTLHAVDIGTLQDQQTPVPISASVKMSNGSTINFDPQNEQSRTSLAFASGALYVGIGSRCDNNAGNIVGWMLKYDTSLNQVASFATAEDTTRYLLDSIWMTGYASAIDASGNIFSVTGNGAFDAATGGHDYGESAIKLDPNLTGVQTSFTPGNWKHLNAGDTDFGSGGIMLLPTQQSSTPNVAVAMGKDSNLFLLNQDNLGGLAQPLQEIRTHGGGVWGGPTFYSGSTGQFVYYQTGGGPLVAYAVSANKNGVTKLSQSASGPASAGYGGSAPIVSSNGQQKGTGIVWLVQRNKTLRLQAYDAENVGRMLFEGKAGTWANPENNGFVTPLEANGKVYVPAQGTISVFGVR